MSRASQYKVVLAISSCGFASLGCATMPLSDSPIPQDITQQSPTTAAKLENGESSGGINLDRRITIQSLPGKEGMEASDILQVIAQTIFSGQLIISPDFAGKFLATIDDRPVREALDAICQQANCSWEVTQSGALKIIDSESIAQP